MTWHYVAAHQTHEGEEVYTVREQYEKYGHSMSPQYAYGETLEDLALDLERMAADVRKHPVLELGELERDAAAVRPVTPEEPT